MSRSRVDALPYEETKTIGLQPEDLTERGVADAFIRRYGSDLLYVETLGLWFLWTGTHFQADHDRTIRHRLGALIQGRAVESLATQDRKLVTLALRALQSRHEHPRDHPAFPDQCGAPWWASMLPGHPPDDSPIVR
jgi:hypothetical protein